MEASWQAAQTVYVQQRVVQQHNLQPRGLQRQRGLQQHSLQQHVHLLPPSAPAAPLLSLPPPEAVLCATTIISTAGGAEEWGAPAGHTRYARYARHARHARHALVIVTAHHCRCLHLHLQRRKEDETEGTEGRTEGIDPRVRAKEEGEEEEDEEEEEEGEEEGEEWIRALTDWAESSGLKALTLLRAGLAEDADTVLGRGIFWNAANKADQQYGSGFLKGFSLTGHSRAARAPVRDNADGEGEDEEEGICESIDTSDPDVDINIDVVVDTVGVTGAGNDRARRAVLAMEAVLRSRAGSRAGFRAGSGAGSGGGTEDAASIDAGGIGAEGMDAVGEGGAWEDTREAQEGGERGEGGEKEHRRWAAGAVLVNVQGWQSVCLTHCNSGDSGESSEAEEEKKRRLERARRDAVFVGARFEPITAAVACSDGKGEWRLYRPTLGKEDGEERERKSENKGGEGTACSFGRRGKCGEVQFLVECLTCDPDGCYSVCRACAVSCHDGHDIDYGESFGHVIDYGESFGEGCGESEGEISFCDCGYQLCCAREELGVS